MQKFRTRNYLKSFIKENRNNSYVELNIKKLTNNQATTIQKKIQPVLLRARKKNQSIAVITH